MDPTLHSVTKYFYDIGWNGFNIEPHPAYYKKLQTGRPRDRNFNCCISNREEVQTFYVFDDVGSSTLHKEIAEHLAEGELKGYPICTHSRTLRNLLAEAPPEIDFLKIDVEGWELQVIQGNDWSKYRPTVVLIEAIDPLTLEPAWREWESELTRHDYAFVYFDGLNRFYLRQESLGLRPAFAAPPNVFDNFELAKTVDVARDRDTLAAEITRLRLRIQSIEQERDWERTGKEAQIQRVEEIWKHSNQLSREREELRIRIDEDWRKREIDRERIAALEAQVAAASDWLPQERDTQRSEELRKTGAPRELSAERKDWNRYHSEERGVLAEIAKLSESLTKMNEPTISSLKQIETAIELERIEMQQYSDKAESLQKLLQAAIERAESTWLQADTIAASTFSLQERIQQMEALLAQERHAAKAVALELEEERSRLNRLVEELKTESERSDALEGRLAEEIGRVEELNREKIDQRLAVGEMAQQKAAAISKIEAYERELSDLRR